MDSIMLFVPSAAILLAIVILFGFSGCFVDATGTGGPPEGPEEPEEPEKPKKPDEPSEVPAPSDLVGVGIGRTQIDLTWNDNAMNSTHFRLTRAENGGSPVTIADNLPVAATNPQGHSDTDQLVEGQLYQYQVFASAGGMESAGSNLADVSTLTMKVCFDDGPTATTGEDRFAVSGRTLVQRIAAALLDFSGPTIRLTVRAASASNLALGAIFISQPAPAGDQWDSAPDLTPVLFQGNTGIVVTAGNNAVSDEIVYALDKTQDLIVAFDLVDPANTRQTTGVAGAQGFLRMGPPEAGVADRSQGYNLNDEMVLVVEKIEVLA
jgi:hypothetical protein